MDRISSKLLQEEASLAKQDFADALKRLNEMRPKSDRSFDIKCLEGEFNLKKELEAILMDTRFQNHCRDDMAYASLWQEYAGMVSDFSEVFEYMLFAPLHIKCNYRAFIQYSQFVEVAWREFQKSHFLFVEGIKAFQGCSKELGILFKMLGLFVERMKQRIERDIISNLSSDAFLDEFGKRPLLFMANLSEMAREEGENFDFLTDEQNTLVKTSSLLVDTYNRSLFLVKQEKFDNDESFQEPSPDEKIVQEFNSKPLSFLSMPSTPLKKDCKNESQPRPQQPLPCHRSRREELLQNIPMDQISEWNASAEQSRKSKSSLVFERESLNLTFMTCQDEGEKANQNAGDSLQLLGVNREAQEEEEEVLKHEQNKTGFNLVFERSSSYNQAQPRMLESFRPSSGSSALQTAMPEPTFSSLPPPQPADRGLESSDKRKRTQLSPNSTSRPRFESSPLTQQPVQPKSHPNRNPPGFNPFSREHAQQASESKKRPGAGLHYQTSLQAPWSAAQPPPAAVTSSPLAKATAPNISGEPQRMLTRKSTEQPTHQDKHEMTISLVRQIKNELEGQNLPDIFKLAENLETFLEGTSRGQNAQREPKEKELSAEPGANHEVSWRSPPLFSFSNPVSQQQPKTVPSISPTHPEEKSPLRLGTGFCPSVNSCTPSQLNALNAQQESSIEFLPDEADHQKVPNLATRAVGSQIMTISNFMNSASSMLVDQEVPDSRTDTFETFGGRNAKAEEGGEKKQQTPLLFALAKQGPTGTDRHLPVSSFGASGTPVQQNLPSKPSPIRERTSNQFQQGSASRVSHQSRSRASPLRLPQQNLNESIFLEQSPGASDAMKTNKNLFFGNSLFGNTSPHRLPQGTQILDSSPLRSEREHPQSSIRGSLHAKRDGPGLFDYVESGRTNFVTGEKEMVFNIVKRSSRRISEISETPQKAGCHEMATRRKSFLPPNSDCDDELSELYLGDLGGDRTTPRKKPEDAEWLGQKAVPLPHSQALSVFNNERKSSPMRTILGQVSTNVMENPFMKQKPATTPAKGKTPLRISSERRSVKFSPINHQHYI